MAMIDQLANRVNNTVKQSQDSRSIFTKVADFFTDDDLDKTKYLGEVSKAREDIWNSQILPKLKAAKANDATVSQAYRTWSKQVDDWSTSNGFKLRQGQSINQQRQQNMVKKLADTEKSGSTSDKVAAKAKVAKVVTGTGLKSVQVGGLRAVGSLAQYVADVGDTNRSSKRQAVANYVKRAGDEAKASNIAYQDIEQNGSKVSKVGLMAGEQVAPLVLTGGVAGATTKGALALGVGVKGAAAAGIGASTAVSYTQNYGDVRQGVEDEFRNATANQLATSKDPNTRTTFNSHYTKYLKKGLSQPDAAEQARLDTISDVAESYAEDYGKLVTALEPISAGAGKFGVKLAGGIAPNLVGKLATRAEQRALGQAVKAQTNKAVAAYATGKAVTGAVGRSAVEEGLQEGVTDWASQKAAVDSGIKASNDWGQTKEAAVYGAILGGLFGGSANIATGQTGYQQAKSQLSQIQQTQAATNAQLNTLQQQHGQLSQVANPTPEQKQQIQAIESNIRELETVKSDNEANAQRLNIPEPVLNKHVETPYNSTLNPQQAQTDNADNPAAPDTNATAQTASPTDTTTNTSASPVNPSANPANPSANGGLDVNQYLDLDANSLEQAWVNHQKEMADNATITDGTDQMSVQDAIEHANNTIAEENTTPQVQGGISGVVARNQQRQTQGELESEMEDWHAKKQQLQAEHDAKLAQEMNTPDEPAIKLMDVNDGEHFDTTVIGLNGEPFRLANAWDSVIPAKAKQQAITTVFGGRLPQKLASASWGELHPQVQKKLHTWFTQELNNRRSEREQLAMPQLGMRTVNPQPVNELPSGNEPINLGFGNNQALTIPDMPVKQQSSNILANSAPSGDLFSQNSQDSQASIAAPKDVSIGADGQPKWFSTAQKANEFIAKKKIGDTHHVVQANPKRYEILPKSEQTQADINTTADQQIDKADNQPRLDIKRISKSELDIYIESVTKDGKYLVKNKDVILKMTGEPFDSATTAQTAIKNRKFKVAGYDVISDGERYIGVRQGYEVSTDMTAKQKTPTDTKKAVLDEMQKSGHLEIVGLGDKSKSETPTSNSLPIKNIGDIITAKNGATYKIENINYTDMGGISSVGLTLLTFKDGSMNPNKNPSIGTFTLGEFNRMFGSDFDLTPMPKAQGKTDNQSDVPKKLSGGLTYVGDNKDGTPLYEDDEGYRVQQVTNGLRNKETSTYTSKGIRLERRTDEFLTTQELKDKQSNQPKQTKVYGEYITKADGSTYQVGNIRTDENGKVERVQIKEITAKDGKIRGGKFQYFSIESLNKQFPNIEFDPKGNLLDSEKTTAPKDKKDMFDNVVNDDAIKNLGKDDAQKVLDIFDGKGKDQKSKPKTDTEKFADNKVFTADKVAAARARMKSKLSQLNSGIDPEMVMDGITITGAYVESGIRKFSDYASAMIEDFGDSVKPYLLSFWESTRHYPSGIDVSGMTSVEDSKKEFDTLIKPQDLQTDAIGDKTPQSPTKQPTKKAKQSKGEMTLTDYWGVEYIDGWSETDKYKGEYSDYGVIGGVKDAFLKEAKNYLTTVADVLSQHGYDVYKDRKGKPDKAVDVNKSGTAGSGEVGLTMQNPVTDQRIYVKIGATSMRGIIPTTSNGVSVMYRTYVGGDRFGGGSNQWAQTDLTADELAQLLIEKANRELERQQPKGQSDDNSLRGTPGRRADSTAPASEPSQGTLAGISTDNVSPVPKTGDTTGQAQSSSRASVSSDESTGRSGAQSGRSAGNRVATVHSTDTRNERVTPKPEQAVTADNTATDYPIAPPQSQDPNQDNSQDFTITEDDEVGKGGLKTKFKQNLEAIKLLKQLQRENRQATKDEQKILTKWVGWGGLKAAFRRGDGSTVNGWAKEVEQLEAVLTPDELDAALNSTIAAHYTEPKIVKAMWKAVEKLGFNGGRVLEPSIGSGIFLGMLPASLRKSTAFYGTELDTITGGLAQQLYPTAAIKVMGFQDYSLQDGFFKVAIGNPPFANIKITDLDRKHLSGLSLHNYFFAKSLDALEDNGVLAMVVTSRLLDGADPKTRNYLFANAELLMAVRLPNNAFKENANTDVTTDIIFLRKRSEAERTNGITNDFDYRGVGKFTDKNGDVVPLNNYFIKNPDHMLGEFGNFGTMYARGENGIETALVAPKGQNTLELLNKVLDKLPTSVITPRNKSDVLIVESMVKNIPDVKVGSMFEQDGNIYERTPDSMGDRQAVAVELPSQKAIERVKGLIGLRTLLSDVRQMQLSSNTDETVLEQRRAELNKAYDQFVKEHGHINSDANKRLFKEDPSWSQLSALEDNYDKGISPAVSKNTGEPVKKPSAKKAAILERRTQYPFAEVTQVSSAKDGMIETLNSVGRLDLARISQLYGKDEQAVIKELGDLIYQDPVQGWVTADNYLSGNVKAKLAQAKEAMAQYGSDYERNVKALEQVQPQDIEAVDIEVRPGAHWIPANHITDFLKDVLGATGLQGVPTYSKFDNDWTLPKFTESAEAGTQFGTSRKSVRDIVTAAMNGKQITVYDQIDRDTRVVNQEATNDANQKVEAVKRAWNDWIWMDDGRRDELARLYNDIFNTDIAQAYDGSHLKLLGKVDDNVIELRPTQKNAIWRITQNPTTLLDHVVGAGKTFTMVAAAMELRRMGLASKPMIVVPNHLVGQWGKEFIQLYPNANILVATKKDFEAANRKRLVARIANGDWDAVIVAHSSFGKIAVSPEFEAEFIKQQIQEITTAIEDAKKDAGKSSNARDLANRRLKLEEKYKKLTASENRDTDNLYWDELGVDALMLDEAHEFKNLAYTTSSMNRVAGLGNQSGSQKAMDLFMKIQQLKQNPSSRIVFATGTPISNSMAEMYTMQRYLDMDRMKNQGIAGFDAWAKTFGEVVNDWELSASGKYQMKSRFAKFVNMPELMQSYLGFADVINRDDINDALKAQGKKLPVPKIKGGAPQNTVVERSPEQAAFIGVPTVDEHGNEKYDKHSLIYRADNLPKGQAAKQKGADNMLKIMGEARKAALDMRIIDPNAPDFAGSKINVAVSNIMRIWRDTAADKGTQLVFCDLSTPKGSNNKEQAKLNELVRLADEGNEDAIAQLEKYTPDELDAIMNVNNFSVYDDMKQKLIAQGIPENEIAFIHDANTELQKDELFSKVRSGRIRVLLGSTSKMGAGTNVQTRLVALHHMDAPWRPSDLEQREGRIIRQGNELYAKDPENFEVEIHRYATEQTMDAMQWQIIENKAKFIEQVRKGDIKTRVIEDIEGEAANAGAMKAAASGNPLILEEMALKKQLNDLDSDKTRHDREQHRIKATIKRTKDSIESLENEQSRFTTLSQAKTPTEFDITVNGKNYKQGQEGARVEAGKAIVSQAIKASMGKEKLSVGQYGDFTISATANPTNRDSAILSLDYRGESIAIEVKHSDPAGGIITKLINRIKEIPDKLQQFKSDLEKSIKAIPKLESQLKPWGKEAELDAIRKKHTEVMDALKPKKDGQPTDKPQYSKRELFAPNGKPSNLTPEQHAQVRTKEFKAWFGDWENDPANASKVVDENGEPLPLYHGTNNEFTVFDKNRNSENSGDDGYYGTGFYFTSDIKFAKEFGEKVSSFFLNIKNPVYNNPDSLEPILDKFGIKKELVSVDKDWLLNEIEKIDINSLIYAKTTMKYAWNTWKNYIESGGNPDGINLDRGVIDNIFRENSKPRQSDFDYIEKNIAIIPESKKIYKYKKSVDIRKLTNLGDDAKEFTQYAIDSGFDGVFAHPKDEYVAFNPNQIKSATNNTGAFDPNNDDIRYSKNSKGATDTTPTQVRDTLVKQFGEKTIKALEDAGVLHIKQLSDFVDGDGHLTIADDAEGFFHDGKAVLIADNIDANQIVPVFLHEMGGHGGLQNMLSAPAYADLMRTFNAMVARGDEVALRAKLRAEASSTNQEQATTEYLPYLLSEISNAQAKTPFLKRILDRFVGAVRAWVFAKTGVKLNLTHADILGLAELTINEQAKAIQNQAKLVEKVGKQYSLNENSDSEFIKAVDDFVAGRSVKNNITLGNTPNVLKMLGFPDVKVKLWDNRLAKILKDKHGLTAERLKQLPKQMNNPVAVLKSSPNSTNPNGFVVLTELTEFNREKKVSEPVIVALHINKDGTVIDVASAYGKNVNGLQKMLNDDDVLYWNKEKGSHLVNAHRLQLPLKLRSDVTLSLNNTKTESDLSQYNSQNITQYSRRFAPVSQNPIPNKPTLEQAKNWLNSQWATKWVSWDTFKRLIRRNIATPQHVAITHADYKVFWDRVQSRINYTNFEAANAVNLVPEILDKRLIIGQNKKDIEAVSKVIFDGTMNDFVYTDNDLRGKGLSDKQIDLYRRVRQAIDESVEKMAIDVIANSAKGTGLVTLDEILRIKEAVLANNGRIAMFNAAMQQAVNAKIAAMQQAGIIDAKKAATLTTMFDNLAKQMDDVENRVYELQDQGYAPLMRFGAYAVAVNDPTTNDLVLYELYETKKEQQKALHDLKRSPDYAGMKFNENVLNPMDYQQFANKGLNPETVMLFANELGLDGDQANQAYLKVAIAQQSAMKRLIHRKKIPGFSEDLPRVLSAFVMSNARHSSRLLYNGDIEKSIQGVKDGDLRGEAQNLFENMENPKEEMAGFRSMMFHWNMGFSPAFGLLNMTQPFIQTIPQLTMYGGGIKAHAAVLGGLRKAMAAQLAEDSKGLGINPNAKEFVDRIPGYMRDDYIRMTKEGHLDPQNVWLLQGLERGKAGVASGVLGMIGQAAGYISEATETMNRRATMYAALEIAHKMGQAELQAKGFKTSYDFAVTTIQQTQGVYNKGNRSGLARSTGVASKFGAVIMMYKQFSINLIEQQIRMGQQKQVKALATAWIYQWLIAGTMGLIGADDLKDIIETIAFKFGYALNTNRKIQEFFVAQFGKEDGNDAYQMFMYGPVSQVLPVDLHGRSSAGNVLPATGLLHPSNAADQKAEAMEALGVGANWLSNMFDAGKLVMNNQYRDAMVTAAPRYIRDSVQAYEIATTGSMRDKNGRKVMDMTQADAVAKALQFNPKSNAQRGREAMNNWQDKKLIENVKSDFSIKLAEAMASKNQAAQDKVIADIDKWNAKNDKQYQMEKEKIIKSAEKRAKKMDFTSEERQTMPQSLEEYVNSLKAS